MSQEYATTLIMKTISHHSSEVMLDVADVSQSSQKEQSVIIAIIARNGSKGAVLMLFNHFWMSSLKHLQKPRAY